MSIETVVNRLKQSGVQPSGRALAQTAVASTAQREPSARLAALPPAGVVSLTERQSDRDAYLPMDLSPEVAEQLRQIRRPIVGRALGRSVDRSAQGNVVLVTSSVPGEGKTFCSLQLAISMAAEREFDVLLIDGDLLNPTLSTRLDLTQKPGLADAIRSGKEAFGAGVFATDVPGLFVMGCGTRDGREAELISGGRVQEIVTHLATTYRDTIVVFDSAPVNETSGARALAPLVGQIVLIVRAGVTPRRMVTQALDLLNTDQPIGIVLNQVTSPQPPAYGSPYLAAVTALPAAAPADARAIQSDLL